MTIGALVSYFGYKNKNLDELVSKRFGDNRPPLFADSGGYSAYTQNIQIDWRDYAKWVKNWGHLFSAYANLDVIGNSVQTGENQLALEQVGLTPVPVCHVGTSFEILAKLFTKYKYVAIGGMVPYLSASKRLMPWLIRAFKLAMEYGVNLHGFGSTDWRVLSNLPWKTVDSTTWRAGVKYGAQLIFAKGRLFQTRSHLLKNYANDLNKLGFSVGEAIRATKGDVYLSERLAIESIKAAVVAHQKRHNTDLCMYLAGWL